MEVDADDDDDGSGGGDDEKNGMAVSDFHCDSAR